MYGLWLYVWHLLTDNIELNYSFDNLIENKYEATKITKEKNITKIVDKFIYTRK